MSSFYMKAVNRKTGTEHAVFCIDDYFGPHAYGYDVQDSDTPMLTEEQFKRDYKPIESPQDGE